MKDQRGFALLAVILVLTLLGIIVMELAFAMRLEASLVRSYKDGILATHLAEAAVQQAIREILSQAPIQGLDEDGTLVFYRAAPGQALPIRLPALPRTRVPFGPGEFTYRITDEEGRLNINSAPPDRVDRLLAALDVGKLERDVINDSLQDWKDLDDLHRLNGAESEDYYLKLPLPYRARNGPLQDIAELLQIRGITRELYAGAAERPRLADLVTVLGRDTVNINTAPVPVLKALGLSEAEIGDITQSRVRTPYTVVPPRFTRRGLGVGSATFRIEAEGFIAGELRARVMAIVQRRAGPPAVRGPGGAAPAPGAVILSWRPGGEP